MKIKAILVLATFLLGFGGCKKQPETFMSGLSINGTEYKTSSYVGTSNTFKQNEDYFKIYYKRWISENPAIMILMEVVAEQAPQTGVRYTFPATGSGDDAIGKMDSRGFVDYITGYRYVATDGWIELTKIEDHSSYYVFSGKYGFTAMCSATGETISVTDGFFENDTFNCE